MARRSGTDFSAIFIVFFFVIMTIVVIAKDVSKKQKEVTSKALSEHTNKPSDKQSFP